MFPSLSSRLLVAQTGLGLSPQFYWATTGAKPRLFAVVIPGALTMLEAGDNVCDIAPAVATFGIEPISLDEQLRRAA